MTDLERLKQIFPSENLDVLLVEIADPNWDWRTWECGDEDWEQYIPDDMQKHWNELSLAEQIIARIVAEWAPYHPHYSGD